MRFQKVQREKVNFKIRQNEIGKYSPSSVDLNGVTDEYLAKFTDVEIEKAKELKAKQKALHEADPNHASETALLFGLCKNPDTSGAFEQTKRNF